MVAEIEITIDSSLNQIASIIGQKSIEVLNDFIVDLADELQQESYRGATLDLAGSWDVIPASFNTSAPLTFQASVVNTEPTARFRVAGRRPGRQPPIDPLTDWVVVKGIAGTGNARSIAFAIARKIAAVGTDRFISGNNFLGLNQDGSLQSNSIVFKRSEELANTLSQINID